MKKVIFSGYLANDKDCFVELSFCSYDYKKDGEKNSYHYVNAFEISPSIKNGGLCRIESATDFVNYVRMQQMCKSDVEKIIKNINKHWFYSLQMFGSEEKSHICQRLRIAAIQSSFKALDIADQISGGEFYNSNDWTADMNYADCLETPAEFDDMVNDLIELNAYDVLYSNLVDLNDMLKQHCGVEMRFLTEKRTFDTVTEEEFLENPDYILDNIWDDDYLMLCIKNMWY